TIRDPTRGPKYSEHAERLPLRARPRRSSSRLRPWRAGGRGGWRHAAVATITTAADHRLHLRPTTARPQPTPSPTPTPPSQNPTTTRAVRPPRPTTAATATTTARPLPPAPRPRPHAAHPAPPRPPPPYANHPFELLSSLLPDLTATASTTARRQACEDEDEAPFAPPLDLFSTPQAYTLHVALPGAKKQDIGVDWDADRSTLRIAGVLHRPADSQLLEALLPSHAERRVGFFERVVALPPAGHEQPGASRGSLSMARPRPRRARLKRAGGD
ncbi:hypothetical protein BJF96_g1960, partial [Verticillium dahliae]